MAFFNFNAKAIVREGEFQVSQNDLEFIEIHSEEWVDKSKPPFDLCRYLMELIDLRFSELLDEGNRKKLAAKLLGMSYFQFNDYLFMAKSANDKKKDSRGQIINLNNLLNSDIEKHRQAQEKKRGKALSPKEHKTSYKANYQEIRKQKIINSIDPNRYKEIQKIIQDYEASAVDSILLTSASSNESLPIGSTKLGGHAHLIPGDKYPVYENGKDMILLAQINIAEIHKLLPQVLPRNKGLLLFFVADEELGGQRNHAFAVRYYPDIVSLCVQEPLVSQSYNETRLEATTIKSLPISPWTIYEEFSNNMGAEAIYIEDFVQDKYQSHGSSFLGYGTNIEMRPISQNGKVISEDIDEFIPLLQINSQHDEGVQKRMMFGDGGAVGFFIKPDDLGNWDFTNVTFTTYN